jgi:hypothetical protein
MYAWRSCPSSAVLRSDTIRSTLFSETNVSPQTAVIRVSFERTLCGVATSSWSR